MDNPAVFDEDTEPFDVEEDEEVTAAQQREEDPDGDPDAIDLEAAEEQADTDPEPQLNDDAEEDLSGLEEGEDLGEDWDDDEEEN